MSDVLPPQLVLLPGAVASVAEAQPAPVIAVGRVLAGNVHAAGLLSEARHRVLLARNSCTAAARAARCCRDAELACELARRRHHPRGAEELHFWAAGALLAILFAASCVIGVALGWHLPGLARAAVAAGLVVLAGSTAWAWSRWSRSAPRLALLLGVAMGAALIMLAVLWATGIAALGLLELAALGVALAATALAGMLVLERAEGWACYRPRLAHLRADRRRQDLLSQMSADQAAAETAVGAWVSLVVEECLLARAGHGTDSGRWVADCAEVARNVAVPR